MVSGCILMVVLFIVVLFNSGVFNNANILSQPAFWLCLSSILFYGCDIPYMGLHNYLSSHFPNLGIQLANINTVLDVIRYPLVAVSFLLLGRKAVPVKIA